MSRAACLPVALAKEPAQVLAVSLYLLGAARRLADLIPQQQFEPCGVGAFCLTCGFKLLSLH